MLHSALYGLWHTSVTPALWSNTLIRMFPKEIFDWTSAKLEQTVDNVPYVCFEGQFNFGFVLLEDFPTTIETV